MKRLILVFAVACLAAALALPAHAATSMTIDKRYGPPTTWINVSGSEYAPNEKVNLYFDAANLQQVVADDNGNFAGVDLQLSAAAVPGFHKIKAVGETSGFSKWRAFTVRTNWPQFPRFPAHRAYNSTENCISPDNVADLTPFWTYTTGGAVTISPAVCGTMVFAGSLDSKVSSLDRNTGAKIWEFATGDRVYSSPAVADGVVYVGTDNGTLYAFK